MFCANVVKMGSVVWTLEIGTSTYIHAYRKVILHAYLLLTTFLASDPKRIFSPKAPNRVYFYNHLVIYFLYTIKYGRKSTVHTFKDY